MREPTGIEQHEDYRAQWLRLPNDESKSRYLLMLKERVFLQHDQAAAAVLPDLAAAWIREPFKV